jgi:uncharacterized protein YdhG (YjbR/CyaY superfamily)
MPDTSSVDAYLASLPDASRIVLEDLRRKIRAAAPGAEEAIAYDMPAFRLNGRFLVSCAAYKRHCSLFPASADVQEACGAELVPYLHGRATIRFRPTQPLPDDLVRRIIEVRVREIQTGSGAA